MVPRARKREEKRIAKATANQTAKDMEDAKAQEKADANLITRPRYSQQSRALNGGLAMASQGIYPSKALGGVGWHEQAYGHLALFGNTYLTMRDLGSNAFGHLALFLCVRAPVYVAISTMAQLTQ